MISLIAYGGTAIAVIVGLYYLFDGLREQRILVKEKGFPISTETYALSEQHLAMLEKVRKENRKLKAQVEKLKASK